MLSNRKTGKQGLEILTQDRGFHILLDLQGAGKGVGEGRKHDHRYGLYNLVVFQPFLPEGLNVGVRDLGGVLGHLATKSNERQLFGVCTGDLTNTFASALKIEEDVEPAVLSEYF